MKSYLAIREISFRSVDVTADPAGREQLIALGAKSTPVVAIGDRWVGGAAYDRLDEFFATRGASGSVKEAEQAPKISLPVGNLFSGDETPRILSESELVSRIDALLVKATAGSRQLDPSMLHQPLPVRGEEGRTVRGLIYHIGQVAQDAIRVSDGMVILKSMHEYDPPDHLASIDVMVEYLEGIRSRFALWWSSSPRPALGVIVNTYQGPYTYHGLLERSCWHTASHVRQLDWVIAESGVPSAAKLTASDLADLPMPRSTWGRPELERDNSDASCE